MSLPCYLTMKGETQGDIKGSVTQAGREDTILVIGVDHEVISPRDPASGLPTGKRQHKPFSITKETDKSTPLLYNMLTNNENITEWKLEYWQPSAAGKEEQHYTVELTNTSICSIRHRVLNIKDPELTRFKEFEEVAFAYQKIVWTWMDGGISAEDDWESPVA
ncbi:MAG: Hcp family type VI secretion system effector [Desulfobacterales bacterium]|nr:Hcp family type VI secretion system effector [Desulfobacterales bacterium]